MMDDESLDFGPEVHPAEFASLGPSQPANGSGIDLLLDVMLNVNVELGRSSMLVKDILALGPGSVIELEKLAGEPVDVFINDTMIARGEVVVVDEKFGVRVTEIIAPGKKNAA
ncbi:MAG: flagellar motor switch protein FliN [Chloroflexi bacterium]|nr:flagellar motor switch protein FliN [Chloroflexota bacterium]